MEPQLVKRSKAAEMLGISARLFQTLEIPFVKIGKRNFYLEDDILAYIQRQRKEALCPSTKGKARRTTGTTSPWTGGGFAEALKQTIRH